MIQGLGPPRQDPGRNSAQDPGPGVPNGGMATHLGANMLDLGSLGVPGPASTPFELDVTGGGTGIPGVLEAHGSTPFYPIQTHTAYDPKGSADDGKRFYALDVASRGPEG